MVEALRGVPPEQFTRPSGIREAVVCTSSGLLATPECPATRKELFSRENVPTKQHTAAAVVAAPTETAVPNSTPTTGTGSVAVGSNQIVVPNVVGLQEKQGQTVLSQAGLSNSPFVNYQGISQVPVSILNTVCQGCVLSTTPGAGQVVPRGTVVHMAVRKE